MNRSRFLAFNVAREIPSNEVVTVRGAYESAKQVWVNMDGTLAACTYGYSTYCSDIYCSPDVYCDDTDATGGSICPWC
jgi:hypothetical protein